MTTSHSAIPTHFTTVWSEGVSACSPCGQDRPRARVRAQLCASVRVVLSLSPCRDASRLLRLRFAGATQRNAMALDRGEVESRERVSGTFPCAPHGAAASSARAKPNQFNLPRAPCAVRYGADRVRGCWDASRGCCRGEQRIEVI